jgi:molybdopterin biosynthesis enzyme
MERRNFSLVYQVTFEEEYVHHIDFVFLLFLGNPVSALVSYWLFVIPTLKYMMGHIQPHHPVIRVQVLFN